MKCEAASKATNSMCACLIQVNVRRKCTTAAFSTYKKQGCECFGISQCCIYIKSTQFSLR